MLTVLMAYGSGASQPSKVPSPRLPVLHLAFRAFTDFHASSLTATANHLDVCTSKQVKQKLRFLLQCCGQDTQGQKETLIFL